jgi:aryl-alcohol dehydrogenase-like predicted oxidoreductase
MGSLQIASPNAFFGNVLLTLEILDTELPAEKSIILGTMRLLELERSSEQMHDFLRAVFRLGIRKLHSSSEYGSFSVLSDLLVSAARNGTPYEFRHVVKLAEPSFDDPDFDARRLEAKIGEYCRKLATNRIDDVQWMWRFDLKDDKKRVSHFERRLENIVEVVARLKQNGLIKRFFCFPYSRDFASYALEHRTIDGLVVYRNYIEREYDDHIERCHDLGKKCIIIRPFFSNIENTQSSEKSHLERLSFSLNKPAIESAILSSNSIDHLSELFFHLRK